MAATAGAPASDWTSVLKTALNHGDAALGDTWWACAINLDVSGKSQNLTEDDRTVNIEVVSIDSNGNKSEPTTMQLVWAVTPAGGADHLIMEGQKLLLSGPLTPPLLPAQVMDLDITAFTSDAHDPPVQGDAAAFTLGQTYSSTAPTNAVHLFDTGSEGHYKLTATVIATDDNNSTLTTAGPTYIHVIKHRVVQAVSYWYGDTPPTDQDDWTDIANDIFSGWMGWEVTVPADADYVLYYNPTPETWTQWGTSLVYWIAGGEQADPAVQEWTGEDPNLLWWSPPLTGSSDGTYQIKFYAQYTEPQAEGGQTLTLEWDTSDAEAGAKKLPGIVTRADITADLQTILAPAGFTFVTNYDPVSKRYSYFAPNSNPDMSHGRVVEILSSMMTNPKRGFNVAGQTREEAYQNLRQNVNARIAACIRAEHFLVSFGPLVWNKDKWQSIAVIYKSDWTGRYVNVKGALENIWEKPSKYTLDCENAVMLVLMTGITDIMTSAQLGTLQTQVENNLGGLYAQTDLAGWFSEIQMRTPCPFLKYVFKWQGLSKRGGNVAISVPGDNAYLRNNTELRDFRQGDNLLYLGCNLWWENRPDVGESGQLRPANTRNTPHPFTFWTGADDGYRIGPMIGLEWPPCD